MSQEQMPSAFPAIPSKQQPSGGSVPAVLLILVSFVLCVMPWPHWVSETSLFQRLSIVYSSSWLTSQLSSLSQNIENFGLLRFLVINISTVLDVVVPVVGIVLGILALKRLNKRPVFIAALATTAAMFIGRVIGAALEQTSNVANWFGFWDGEQFWQVIVIRFALPFAMLILSIIGVALSGSPRAAQAGVPTLPTFGMPAQPAQFVPSTSAEAGGAQQTAKPWRLQLPGQPAIEVDTAQLRAMANVKMVVPATMIEDAASGLMYPASQIPGLYSQRTYVATLLLSLFLGYLGIDRFYLGHTGLGIAKLLTAGGCGVWAFIDFILIALRKVTDSEGRMLL